MKTLITGATGLIGRGLMSNLEDAVVLSRDPSRARSLLGDVEVHSWQPEEGLPPASALSGVDAILHLAGEPVGEGRWSEKKKRSIRESRVEATRNLVAGLRGLDRRPSVLVCASAVGYYGDRGDEELTEESAPGSGFLAKVCVDWEEEALAAEDLGLRVVTMRTGVVLSPRGGALSRMLPMFKNGLGGPLSGGGQWMPWIHEDDVVGMYLHAAKNDHVRGPMNVVSPQPVTNLVFTKTLGAALSRPTIIPVPRLGLRIAFGEMSDILTASQRVVPKAATETGYSFAFEGLERAVEACLQAAPVS